MKKQKIRLALIFTFCLMLFIAPAILIKANFSASSSNSGCETSVTASAKTLRLADSATEKISAGNCAEYEMEIPLFRVLLELAKRIDSNVTNSFEVDTFNPSLHNEDYYSPSEDGEKVLEDLKNGVLNLSVGRYAEYPFLSYSNITAITNIRGLNNLKLNNIKVVKLNGNKITGISNLDFAWMDNLTEIYAESNGLKSFSLNSGLKKVNILKLSNNNLKEIDLSSLVNNNQVAPEVDLSCNKIEKLEDLKFNLPLKKLDISFNNLSDLTPEDIIEINRHMKLGSKANILIQGASNFSSLHAGDEVKIYQGEEINNLSAKIFYSSNSSLSSKSQPIFETNSDSEITTIKMPAGKINIKFYSDDKLINATNFPTLNEGVLARLSSEEEYQIAVKGVTFKTYVDGKEVNSLKQSKDVTVKLLVENIENIPNASDLLSSENTNFYYINTNSGIVNSDTITVNSNGTFTYYAYFIFDGVRTVSNTNIRIVRRDNSSITTGVIVIIIVFVVCSAIYFVIKWIREGAQIAPLSEKEVARLNKRRGALAEKSNNDDYISSLDSPRHSTRVSDQGYSDDVLQEDLNSIKKSSYDRLEDLEDVKPTDFPEDINK